MVKEDTIRFELGATKNQNKDISIALSNNLVFHNQNRDISIRHHFIREFAEIGE